MGRQTKIDQQFVHGGPVSGAKTNRFQHPPPVFDETIYPIPELTSGKMNSISTRILFSVTVFAASCLCSEIQAQRSGGLFQRLSQGKRITRQHSRFHPKQYSQNARTQGWQNADQSNSSIQTQPFGHQSNEPLHIEAARNYRNWRSADPYNFYDLSDRYPKYYGAFHSSQLNNIGIPHGDQGFRGNSIFWTPW